MLPSPLLSPITFLTSMTRPLIPIDAAHALLELGTRDTNTEGCPGLFSSGYEGLTGTGSPGINTENSVLSLSPLEPLVDALDGTLPELPSFMDSLSPELSGVQRTRKGQQSKADTILCALQMLKKARVTATELLELVANGSQPGLAYFHSGFYATRNHDCILSLFNTIWAHPKGKTLLEGWMHPHAIDLVCKSVHREMEAAKPFLKMGVSEVTPEFVSNWDIRKTMEPIGTHITPVWTKVLNAATQPKLEVTLENTQDEDDSRNRRTVCLSSAFFSSSN
jgi:hypothetical protein